MSAIHTTCIPHLPFVLWIQSEAEVKSQKQLLAKKGTSSTTSTSSTSPPRQPTVAREEATDSGSTHSSTSTSGDHGSQPVATTSPDGLRQRSSAASNSPGTYSNTNNFSSMVSAATRQSRIPSGDALTPVPSRGWGSLILMWVLLIAIALLVARRVYATYYGPSSEQGLWEYQVMLIAPLLIVWLIGLQSCILLCWFLFTMYYNIVQYTCQYTRSFMIMLVLHG